MPPCRGPTWDGGREGCGGGGGAGRQAGRVTAPQLNAASIHMTCVTQQSNGVPMCPSSTLLLGATNLTATLIRWEPVQAPASTNLPSPPPPPYTHMHQDAPSPTSCPCPQSPGPAACCPSRHSSPAWPGPPHPPHDRQQQTHPPPPPQQPSAPAAAETAGGSSRGRAGGRGRSLRQQVKLC
jgi:hypothetical protein